MMFLHVFLVVLRFPRVFLLFHLSVSPFPILDFAIALHGYDESEIELVYVRWFIVDGLTEAWLMSF